jgi:hypothetical protein
MFIHHQVYLGVQFEQLDVHAGVMEASMAGATTLSAPEDQIEALIRQVGINVFWNGGIACQDDCLCKYISICALYIEMCMQISVLEARCLCRSI